MEMYDEGLDVFEAARSSCKVVDMARGKGRLGREKMAQEEVGLN